MSVLQSHVNQSQRKRSYSENLDTLCCSRKQQIFHNYHKASSSSHIQKNVLFPSNIQNTNRYFSDPTCNNNNINNNDNNDIKCDDHDQDMTYNRRRAFSQNEVQRYIVRRRRAGSMDSISAGSISSMEENILDEEKDKKNKRGCIRLLVRQNSPTRDLPIETVKSTDGWMYSRGSTADTATVVAMPVLPTASTAAAATAAMADHVMIDITQLPPEMFSYLNAPHLTNRKRAVTYDDSFTIPQQLSGGGSARSLYMNSGTNNTSTSTSTSTSSSLFMNHKRKTRHTKRRKYGTLIAIMSFYIMLFGFSTVTLIRWKDGRVDTSTMNHYNNLNQGVVPQGMTNTNGIIHNEEALLLRKKGNQINLITGSRTDIASAVDTTSSVMMVGNPKRTLRQPKFAQASTLGMQIEQQQQYPRPKLKEVILTENEIKKINSALSDGHEVSGWEPWYVNVFFGLACISLVVVVLDVTIKNHGRRMRLQQQQRLMEL